MQKGHLGLRQAFLDWGVIREGWGTALPPLTTQERGGGRAKWVSDSQTDGNNFQSRGGGLNCRGQSRAPCPSPGSGPKATGSGARCCAVFVYLKMLETEKSVSEWGDGTLEVLWREDCGPGLGWGCFCWEALAPRACLCHCLGTHMCGPSGSSWCVYKILLFSAPHPPSARK